MKMPTPQELSLIINRLQTARMLLIDVSDDQSLWNDECDRANQNANNALAHVCAILSFLDVDPDVRGIVPALAIDNDYRIAVCDAMRSHGGGFVQHLAEACIRADPDNFARLRMAFPELWQKYSDVAKGKVKP